MSSENKFEFIIGANSPTKSIEFVSDLNIDIDFLISKVKAHLCFQMKSLNNYCDRY